MNFVREHRKELGRVEVMGLAGVKPGGVVSPAAAGRDDIAYFMIRAIFSSDSEYFIDSVPTGIIDMPSVYSPEEIIITDGEQWMAARYLTKEQLEVASKDKDSKLYIIDDCELPPRLQVLTVSDQLHILGKIKTFCTGL